MEHVNRRQNNEKKNFIEKIGEILRIGDIGFLFVVCIVMLVVSTVMYFINIELFIFFCILSLLLIGFSCGYAFQGRQISVFRTTEDMTYEVRDCVQEAREELRDYTNVARPVVGKLDDYLEYSDGRLENLEGAVEEGFEELGRHIKENNGMWKYPYSAKEKNEDKLVELKTKTKDESSEVKKYRPKDVQSKTEETQENDTQLSEQGGINKDTEGTQPQEGEMITNEKPVLKEEKKEDDSSSTTNDKDKQTEPEDVNDAANKPEKKENIEKAQSRENDVKDSPDLHENNEKVEVKSENQETKIKGEHMDFDVEKYANKFDERRGNTEEVTQSSTHGPVERKYMSKYANYGNSEKNREVAKGIEEQVRADTEKIERVAEHMKERVVETAQEQVDKQDETNNTQSSVEYSVEQISREKNKVQAQTQEKSGDEDFMDAMQEHYDYTSCAKHINIDKMKAFPEPEGTKYHEEQAYSDNAEYDRYAEIDDDLEEQIEEENTNALSEDSSSGINEKQTAESITKDAQEIPTGSETSKSEDIKDNPENTQELLAEKRAIIDNKIKCLRSCGFPGLDYGIFDFAHKYSFDVVGLCSPNLPLEIIEQFNKLERGRFNSSALCIQKNTETCDAVLLICPQSDKYGSSDSDLPLECAAEYGKPYHVLRENTEEAYSKCIEWLKGLGEGLDLFIVGPNEQEYPEMRSICLLALQCLFFKFMDNIGTVQNELKVLDNLDNDSTNSGNGAPDLNSPTDRSEEISKKISESSQMTGNTQVIKPVKPEPPIEGQEVSKEFALLEDDIDEVYDKPKPFYRPKEKKEKATLEKGSWKSMLDKLNGGDAN